MIPIYLKKIVEQRRQRCQEGHLTIDTIKGTANGYTKAGRIQSHSFLRQTQENHKNITPSSSNVHTLPVTSPGINIFEYLGVDESG